MADPIGVLTAVTGAPWEAAFIAQLAAEPGRLRITRRCVDVADLLAAASAGHGQAALVAAELVHLDPDVIETLAAAGVPTVGVAAGDSLEESLLRIGVMEVLAPDASPGDVLAAISRAHAAHRVPPGTARADPARAHRTTSAGTATAGESTSRGSLVAVWGPTGAPGRTTVAITIAAEAARMQRQALLADIDTYGGAVAQTLGLLDEAPGIAAACRSASAGQLDASTFARHARTLAPSLRVLTGITRTTRWPELRPSALETVWRLARASAELVVADCGFSLEQDEELTFDTAAPRRNGATLTTLAQADVVLAVGSADPIGVQRLVRGLAELVEVVPDVPVRVVVNRVRRSVVGADPESQIASALHRYAGIDDVTMIPDDPTALDAALLHGRTLDEVAPGAPARRVLAALTADLLGVPAPRHGRRRGSRRRTRVD